MKVNLKQLSEEELKAFVERLGQEPYRARQIINWIYKRHAVSFEEMTDLSKPFRRVLEGNAFISRLKLLKRYVSGDGTQKFLFELEDGETIESVLIPDKNRLTLCISSQVGCAMGCKFCMSGKIGLRRNLKNYEIVDQIIEVERWIKTATSHAISSITNIVFMGMGEPLYNFNEVMNAIRKITDLMGFSKRRITISTVGIIPKIYELGKSAPSINLAISLNATTDEVRNKIMPVNKRYPMQRLIEACKVFPLSPRKRITFEYVLLNGINDSEDDALRLAGLLKGIRSKVNLIPYNPIERHRKITSFEFQRPPHDKILRFQEILLRAGVTTLIRKSKGVDIFAACGQLRASYLPRN